MATLTQEVTGIDFGMNENQLMIADMIRKFGEEHIRPKLMEWDESQEFPIHVFKKLGELGLMGVLVPTEYGDIFCISVTKSKRKNIYQNLLPLSGSVHGV